MNIGRSGKMGSFLQSIYWRQLCFLAGVPYSLGKGTEKQTISSHTSGPFCDLYFTIEVAFGVRNVKSWQVSRSPLSVRSSTLPFSCPICLLVPSLFRRDPSWQGLGDLNFSESSWKGSAEPLRSSQGHASDAVWHLHAEYLQTTPFPLANADHLS